MELTSRRCWRSQQTVLESQLFAAGFAGVVGDVVVVAAVAWYCIGSRTSGCMQQWRHQAFANGSTSGFGSVG